MRIVFLLRAHFHAARPHKIDRLCDEAVRAGHTVLFIDFAELDTFYKDGSAHVFYRGEPLEKYDIFYWAFDWDDADAWEILPVVQSARYRLYMPHDLPLSDKATQARLLNLHEIPTPETRIVSLERLDLVAAELYFPLVMKGRYGARGEQVFWVENVLDIQRYAAELALAPGEPFILQEVITPTGQDLRVFVVENQVVAAMVRTSCSDDFRANYSQGARVEKAELSEAEAELARRAAAAFGAPHAGVDLMRGAESRTVVLEVNMWPGLKGIEEATGVNIAALIIRQMENMVG